MKFVTQLTIGVAAILVVIGYLIATGMWNPSVVSLAQHTLGDEAAETIDSGARKSVEAGKQALQKAKEIDFTKVASTLDEISEPLTVTRIPKYDREEQFGKWVMQDNGCNTRQSILARDLKSVTYADDDCTVLTGTLKPDPYTGTTLKFTHDRLGGDSQAVQIDHIVPLSVAWKMGAYEWSQEKRVKFANDFGNLIAVDGDANSDKSNSTPDDWMPENTSYQCTYAANYVNVTEEYGLSMEDDTKSFLAEVLAQC